MSVSPEELGPEKDESPETPVTGWNRWNGYTGSRDDFVLFPSLDPSADYGRSEGLSGYEMIANEHPDWTVEKTAISAVRLAMIVDYKFDIDLETAVAALTAKLFAGFPADVDEYTGE